MSLKTIRQPDAVEFYPQRVLVGCESALILFAAAFLGTQDAVWVADADMTGTCVDLDADKLGMMMRVYPDGWEYVKGDVFTYAGGTDREWDVVSVDCPTNLFARCASLLPLWCSLAQKAVILGCGDRLRDVPEGWTVTGMLHRSNFQGGVYWAVLEKTS